MKKRFRAFALCLALTSLSSVISSVKASEIGLNVKAQTQFIKSIPPHATLAQIKRLLPADTKYTAPQQIKAEGAFGNIVRFHGKLNGELVFLNAEQARQETNYRLSPQALKKLLRYHTSDGIKSACVIMDEEDARSPANEKKRIQAASRYLGKAKIVSTSEGYDVDSYAGAIWLLPHNVIIDYGISYFGHRRTGEAILLREF